jgi:hypothetical protein
MRAHQPVPDSDPDRFGSARVMRRAAPNDRNGSLAVEQSTELGGGSGQLSTPKQSVRYRPVRAEPANMNVWPLSGGGAEPLNDRPGSTSAIADLTPRMACGSVVP